MRSKTLKDSVTQKYPGMAYDPKILKTQAVTPTKATVKYSKKKRSGRFESSNMKQQPSLKTVEACWHNISTQAF